MCGGGIPSSFSHIPGGDKELKAVLQWLAASDAGRAVQYFVFSKGPLGDRLESLVGTVRRVDGDRKTQRGAGVTVGEVAKIVFSGGFQPHKVCSLRSVVSGCVSVLIQLLISFFFSSKLATFCQVWTGRHLFDLLPQCFFARFFFTSLGPIRRARHPLGLLGRPLYSIVGSLVVASTESIRV